VLAGQTVNFNNSEFAKIFAEIQQEWDKAEHCIKLCEQFSKNVNIPSVKELRYAGRRIIDALNDAQQDHVKEDVLKKLNDALFRCHCAQHDAIDVSLDIMALDFDNMEKRLKYPAIVAAYPSFSELYADFASARQLTAKSRGDRRDRQAIYETVTQTNLPELAKKYSALKACKPIMLAFAAKAKRQQIGWWVMLAITITSVSFAAWPYLSNITSSNGSAASTITSEQ
jgi:hypothetical protein